jgi:hypothetical protein
MNKESANCRIDPPSRHVNPFATCWTRPGAIPFHFRDGQTASQLVAKLAARDWQGAIIGPHGSGKSTLLRSLEPELVAAGRTVYTIALQDGQRSFPRIRINSKAGALLIIDGYEQLSWLERCRLRLCCRSTRAGLLITSHKRTRLPTLIRLSPDRRLVERLVADICAQMSTSITPQDIAASHSCHGSNVREILFELYDRHEQQRRLSPTAHRADFQS